MIAHKYTLRVYSSKKEYKAGVKPITTVSFINAIAASYYYQEHKLHSYYVVLNNSKVLRG